MATFQDVRGFFEAQAMADLKAAGIADNLIFFDNVGETPGRPISLMPLSAFRLPTRLRTRSAVKVLKL